MVQAFLSRASTAASSPARRDARIDMLRGLALLIITIDHIRGNPIRKLTPAGLGFSDMAELFVFLSGYVCGTAYGRRLRSRGFWSCQWRACCRIYAANALMLVAFILVIRLWHWMFPGAGYSAEPHRVAEVLSSPESHIGRIMSLGFEPLVFSILPFYMLMLVFVPSLLAISRRKRGAVLFGSIMLYSAVQCWPDVVTFRDPWRTAWFFNPCAWQLMFVIGLALGDSHLPRCISILKMNALTTIAIIGLESAVAAAIYFGPDHIPFTGKANLEPLRLVHFSFVVIVIIRFLPSTEKPIWSSQWLRPLVICGRNSLATYCAAGIISTLGTLILASCLLPPSMAVLALVNAAAVLATLVAARTSEVLTVRLRLQARRC